MSYLNLCFYKFDKDYTTYKVFLVNDETKTILHRGIIKPLGVLAINIHAAGIYISLCELAKASLVPVGCC
jgi:hypothetical protein